MWSKLTHHIVWSRLNVEWRATFQRDVDLSLWKGRNCDKTKPIFTDKKGQKGRSASSSLSLPLQLSSSWPTFLPPALPAVSHTVSSDFPEEPSTEGSKAASHCRGWAVQVPALLSEYGGCTNTLLVLNKNTQIQTWISLVSCAAPV